MRNNIIIKYLSLIFVLLLAPMDAYAQHVQIGVGGGSTYITGNSLYKNELYAVFDQVGSETKLTKLTGLDFNSGYNLGFNFRLLFENSHFSILGGIDYNSLIGKGKMLTPSLSMNPIGPKPTESESHISYYNYSLGIEYGLLKGSIIPVLSSSIIINNIMDIMIHSSHSNSFEYKVMEGGARYGVSVGMGIYYKLISKVLLNVTSSYTFNNLIGKKEINVTSDITFNNLKGIKEQEENINTVKINFNIFYEL
jgi:hypothetical protein